MNTFPARATPETGPFVPPALRALPLGTITPGGWLRDQLRMQADGLTGHLEELWPDVGPRSAWLGGDGEDWERGPYYCDGLVPLAYILRDERLLGKARRWIESVLASQRVDGQFGPATNDDWWPRMIMLKVLAQYHEATEDPRVLLFMARYFRYQQAMLPERPLAQWARARGADNLLMAYWLWERTGDASLPALADLLIAQTTDWGTYLTESLPMGRQTERNQTERNQLVHVVNVAMGLKLPAMRFMRDGQDGHLRAIDRALDNVMRHHGQVQGMFSGDEYLAGVGPAQGTELCAVVEFMYTLEQLVRVYGAGRFADRLEVVAFNALPATVTADMRAHQYHQQPNQVLATVAPRDWSNSDETSNIFGLAPNFGCCTANVHQGWPKLTASLWMSTPDGGLAAVVYAPCTVTAHVAETGVTIEESTAYPFEGNVRFTIRPDQSVAFPLLLRVPAWCPDAHVSVNGEPADVDTLRDGFITLRRVWHGGDVVDLTLPLRPRAVPRPQGAIGIARGPLVFALEIGEAWWRLPGSVGFGDWEVRPTTPWNYALAVDPDDPATACVTPDSGHRGALAAPPFDHDHPMARLRVKGRRVPTWDVTRNSAAPPPTSPVRVEGPPEDITLIPYGCARLRIAEFPILTPD